EPGEVGPGVDVQAAAATQVPQQLAVHDAEVEAELVPHLVPPLDLERSGANDQDATCPVADDQLEDDQPGLDGLAQADRVEDAEADPGHLDGPHHGVELVVLDLDAGAEGGLDGADVGGAGRPPPHGVEEGVQAGGRVEPGRVGQGQLLVDAGAGLQLPDGLPLLAQGGVLDGGQGDEALG